METQSADYEPPQYATQFALWQLFAVTTAVAVAAGVAAPWIRAMTLKQWGHAGLALLLVVLTYLWSNYLFAAAYMRTIAAIGKPLGQVPFRPIIPRYFVIGSLAALAVVSLVMVAAMVNVASLSFSQRIANMVQGTLIAGISLAAIRKRVLVKTLLIYGTCGLSDGDNAYRWSAVVIRQGTKYNTVSLRRSPLTHTVTTQADVTPLLQAKGQVA